MVYYFFYKCNLCFSLLYLVLSTHLCSTLLFDPQCTLLFHCSADILLVSILVCFALNYHNTLYLSLLYSIFLLSTSWFQSAVVSSSLFSLLLSTPYCTLIPSLLILSLLLSSPFLFSTLLYSPSLLLFPTCSSIHFSPPLSCPLLCSTVLSSTLVSSFSVPSSPLLLLLSTPLFYSIPFSSVVLCALVMCSLLYTILPDSTQLLLAQLNFTLFLSLLPAPVRLSQFILVSVRLVNCCLVLLF